MSLQELYNSIVSYAGKDNIDSYKVMNAVQKHRFFWKPDKVKTILLAESHVFTRDDDVKKHIYYPNIDALKGCPTEYVRVVYCLGAGENSIVDVRPNPPKSQFWKIFTACASDTPIINFSKVLVGGTPNNAQRIKNKTDILVKLKEKGVWLLDASLVAQYKTNTKKISPKIRKRIILLCWDNYLSDLINKVGFENFIVIGKDVAKFLGNRLPSDAVIMNQPQAQLRKDQHPNHQDQLLLYQKICNQ